MDAFKSTAKVQSSTNDPPPEWEEEIRSKLLGIIAAHNQGDFDPLSPAHACLAPDYTTSFEDSATVLTLHEVLDHLRERGVMNIRVESLSVEISRNRATATTFLELETAGAPAKDLRMRILAVQKWRRREERWICYYGKEMKNVPDVGPQEE